MLTDVGPESDKIVQIRPTWARNRRGDFRRFGPSLDHSTSICRFGGGPAGIWKDHYRAGIICIWTARSLISRTFAQKRALKAWTWTTFFFFRGRLLPRSRFRRSRLDLADSVGTSIIGIPRKSDAGPLGFRPNPSLEPHFRAMFLLIGLWVGQTVTIDIL